MKEENTKILAAAVYQLLKSKPKDGKEIVQNFLAYLAARRLLPQAPKILAELEKLHDQDQQIMTVTVETRNKITEQTEKAISRLLENRLKNKVKIKKIINETLLGGLVIRYQDKVLDLSLRRQLNNLHKQLTN